MTVEEVVKKYRDLIEGMQGPVRFVATGDTYPYREKFTSWAWYWVPERKAWCYEVYGVMPDDLCVLVMMDLPSVSVVVERWE